MARTPRTPPVRVVRAVEALRTRVGRLYQGLVPGNIALLDLGTGAWVTQMLYVATYLGIPDQLSDGPRSSADVARAVGADPDATHRLLRALAGKGVLRQRRDGSFELTRIGKALRTGSDGSLRDMMLFTAHPTIWQDWGNLLASVRNGQSAPLAQGGTSFFQRLDAEPGLATTFNDAMTAMSALTNDAVLAAGDFGTARLIVDVGGGHGSFLSSILERNRNARGVLYDREPVVAGVTAGARFSVEAGSFFDAVPAGADTYLLRNIIHDWDDDEALQILRNVRSAVSDGGTLLLVEMVMPERANSHFAELLDMLMLVAVGGRERTEAEYSDLLGRAGFRLVRITPTATPMSILEAVPV